MKLKLKRLLAQLLAFIPRALPFGLTEFETWSARIIFTYDLPDNDSTRWALATMIQHCGATEATKPDRYFGRCARKGGANQVSAYIMQSLKQKQKDEEAARLAAEAAKAADDAEKARLENALAKTENHSR
jgi:hypothetical protein